MNSAEVRPLYVHLRSSTGKVSMTVCFLSLEEDPQSDEYYTRMGVSFCHRTEDRFTKKEGRDLALKRAMEEPARVGVPKWVTEELRAHENIVYKYQSNYQRAGHLYVRWNSYPYYSAALMVEALFLSREDNSDSPSWLKAAPSWGENLAATLGTRFIAAGIHSEEDSRTCFPAVEKLPPVEVTVPKRGFWNVIKNVFGLSG